MLALKAQRNEPGIEQEGTLDRPHEVMCSIEIQDIQFEIQVERIKVHEGADAKIRDSLPGRRDECFGPFL